MFCRNCGAEMSDTARFCSKCGYDRMGETQQSQNKIVEDNTIKYQIKPKFNVPYKILSNVSRVLIALLVILGTFPYAVEVVFVFPILLVFALLISVLYIVIKMSFDKKQYDNLEYNFYTTKVEYKDGYINIEEKELKYKNIREVVMRQSILERMFNIGTIRIYTNASSAFAGTGTSHNNMGGTNGIFIHCVENVKENYNAIKEIIDAGTIED